MTPAFHAWAGSVVHYLPQGIDGSDTMWGLLTPEQQYALLKLSDTRHLCVGTLSETACRELQAQGLVRQNDDGCWRLSPAGRELVLGAAQRI